MSGGLPFPEIEYRRRTAREIAEAGGTHKDCATRWKVGVAQAREWLRANCPDFPIDPRAPGRSQLTEDVILARLQKIQHALAAGVSRHKLARKLGYSSRAVLRRFILNNAPDGIDAAIARLSTKPKHNKAA